MLARLRSFGAWVRARLAAAIFAAIGTYAAILAMRQSYHFGHGLGVTEVGKESYAQWLTLTDVATAVLPIATVVLWRLSAKKSALVLGVATAAFTVFSISNQIGFGAAERLGQSARVEAINKAYREAKAEQKQLRDGTIAWLKGTATNRGVLKSSRMESIASTERLIASAGTIDPDKVYYAPTDIQAASLASLLQRWTSWKVGTEDMALFLVVSISIIGIAIKPIFFGLAAFFYDRKPASVHAEEKAKPEDQAIRSVSRETSAETPPVETSVPHHDAPESRDIPAPLAAAGGDEPAREVLGSSDEKPAAEPAQVVKSDQAVVPLRSFLKADEEGRVIVPFKGKDTRRHAKSTDGHVEAFLELLSSETQAGDSVPFQSSVFESYKRFCADNNLRHMHDKALSNALAQFGIVRHRPTGSSVYVKLPKDLTAKVAARRQFFETDDATTAMAH